MPLVNFSLDNPLLVNLSLIMVLVLGVVSWHALPQEIFPVVQLDVVSIRTEFEGASPAEVEQLVTLPIELEFEDHQDIDNVTSISNEGMSSIFVRLKPGSNVDDFMQDARTILDRIDTLPDIAEEPELSRIRTRFPVITLTLYGSGPDAELFTTAEAVKRRMQQIPGVASVGAAGMREWEIWVEVDPFELAALRVSLAEVMLGLRDNLRDQPGGSIRALEGDIRLRGQGVAPDPERIRDIALRTNADGGQLRIGDLAAVSRRFEEPITYARFNGRPSVNLTVTKTADASTIVVSRLIRELGEGLHATLPRGIEAGVHTDMSVYVESRLNTVKSSALIGLVLVLLSLYLLLDFRVALITAFGIPVSFFFAIILLDLFGFTINMVSLFAFLIVLGMIVDDAIIVTENIYRHIEQGRDRLTAASIGTREVFWPVVVATLTTIAAFVPMAAVGSILGEFIKVIPVVVCAALFGSLLEAFIVLPSHAAHFLHARPPVRKRRVDWASGLARYGEWVRWAALNRYLVAAISVGGLAIAMTFAATRLPYEQFGEIEIGQFFINVETPNTYSLEDSLALTKELEKSIMNTIREDELDTLLSNVGISFIDFQRFRMGSNLIQFVVDLEKPVPRGFIERWVAPVVSMKFTDFGRRERSTNDIIDAVREEFRRYGAVKRMSILKPQGGPAGDDVEIGVVSADIDIIQRRAEEIRDYLARMPGVKDAQHDQEAGKLEYRYELNERGRRLGLTQSMIADAVRSGFLGTEVVHVTWSDKRIPVRVIYPDPVRRQSETLASLPIVLNDGRIVYLGDVADISVGRGLNQIRRRDGQRMARISAEVDSAVITPLQVAAQIEQEFRPADPATAGYELLFLGERRDAEEAFSGMYSALLIALLVIFFMLTALFKSLLDPIVVMLAIPFGFIGVVIGHALFGYNIQFLSIIGMLALSGIIVNDSLILVDFIKKERARGADRIAAVVEAGKVRARPIILTTVTTFLGVSPLIFFATGDTKFLSPMAVSLGFGLLFATVLILLTLPCLYLIADDLRERCSGFIRRALQAAAAAT